jgi:hypothetical protein
MRFNAAASVELLLVAPARAEPGNDPRGSIEMGGAMHRDFEGERDEAGGVERLWCVVLTVEGILLFGGIVTAVAGVAVDSERALGAGLGLAGTGAAAFGLDYSAYARAEHNGERRLEFRLGAIAGGHGLVLGTSL